MTTLTVLVRHGRVPLVAVAGQRAAARAIRAVPMAVPREHVAPMTDQPLILGVLIGLALAMSTRTRDALVEGLGRRSPVLGLAGAAGVVLIHIMWLGLATLVAAGSAASLGPLIRPLAIIGAAFLLGVAADVTLRALTLGPSGGSPQALPGQPVRTFLQMAVVAAIDPRALAVLLGWLALAPSTVAVVDPGAVLSGIAIAVVGWWLALVWMGVSSRSASRMRRLANVIGAVLLIVTAVSVLLG